MGYLLITTLAFAFGLITNALFLGLLSHWLYGTVQDWVLLISVIVGFVLAWRAGSYYEDREWQRARRR